MLSAQRFKEVGVDGVNRFAGTVTDMQMPWKGHRAKKVYRSSRLLWIMGALVGFLAVIGLLWELSRRLESAEGDGN